MLLWPTRPNSGVTGENFRHLRVGMSARYVDALLGKPNKTYESAISRRRVWWSDEIEIILDFNVDRLAKGKAFFLSGCQEYTGQVEHIHPSFLDRIRRLLHL